MARLSIQSADFHDNAHAHFARMREHTPVYRARLRPFKDVYLVTRYEDVKALLSSDQLVKSPESVGTGHKRSRWMPAIVRGLMSGLLTSDDPAHKRLRRLIGKAFTPKRVSELGPRISQITDELVSDLARDDAFDLIERFALPLPVRVIAELVGVPEQDLDLFMGWVHRITQPAVSIKAVMILPALREFLNYISKLANLRRADPRDDLMTALVQAEERGSYLSEEELQAMVITLLTAGHETTVSLISNGVRALLNHPEQWALLKQDPARHIDAAIEEVLRYDGPLLTTELYYARQRFELCGVMIPEGAAVLPAIASANRDAAVFDTPDRFDITREHNPHLAFGRGVHFCVGAPLARLEARYALLAIIAHMPEIELAQPDDTLELHSLWILNKLKALPVRSAS